MKIGCSSWSFHRDIAEKRLTFDGFLEACAEMKMDGVELLDFHLPTKDPAHLKEVKRKTDLLNLDVCALAVSNDFIKADPKELQSQIDYVNQWIRMAAMLKVKVVRVFGGDIHGGEGPEKAYEMIKAGFQNCVRLAKSYGVTLALENHGTFTSNPNIVLRLINEFKSESFRSCLDAGNFSSQIRYEAVKRVAPFAVHVHAKTYNFDEGGNETLIDYKRVMSILRETGYHGFLSIEYEGLGDETQGVKKSYELLKRLL